MRGVQTYQHVGEGLSAGRQKHFPQKGLLHAVGHLDGQGSEAGLRVKLLEGPGVVLLGLGVQHVHVHWFGWVGRWVGA